MATSKKRGGAKAHKQRVATRNQAINSAKTKFQKEYAEMVKTKMEELKVQYETQQGQKEITAEVVETIN
ncbi:MAG: hypothetical protein WCO49_20865 [Nostocales cyanobacterium ELA608]